MASTRLCPSAVAEAGVAAAGLVGAAGVARMLWGGSAGGPLPALLGTALAGFAVAALLRRTRLTPSLGAVCATVAVCAVAVWFAALDVAGGRFPTAWAFQRLPADVRGARGQLASFHLPLHAGPGVLLLGAVLTGIAGLVARLLLGPLGTRRPRLMPALALLPAAALVGWSCLAVTGDSGPVLAGGLAFAATVALAYPMERPGGGAAPQARRAHPRPSALTAAVGLAAVAAAVGVGIPVGVTAAGGGESRVPATALSLSTGLVRIEHRDAQEVLFRARSPIPTYWQVGVLAVWRDDHWVTGPSTASTAPAVPTASDAHRFTASVTIAHLSSRLLPVPPSTVSVTAPRAVPSSQGVAVPSPSRPGDTYRASAVALSVGTSTTGTVGGLSALQLARMIALPSVPALVGSLARQITATATSPLAEAEELVNWFRSGRFRYTLTPPAAPRGSDPLVDFLTVTRAGTCESFAGAFAVMARSLGLPTRVAVGFTDGRPSADGTTTVVGADAHAWPEVFLGTTLGWVSFEPTPEQASGSIAPPDVVGPTVPSVPIVPTTTPASTPSTTTPSATTPPTIPPTTPTTAAPTPTTTGRTATTTPRRHRVTAAGGVPWWPFVAGLAGLSLVAGLFVARRRRRRRLTPPGQRVVFAFGQIERGLRRAGIGRPSSRTPVAHARALVDAARSRPPVAGPGTDQLLSLLGELQQLAQLVERAGYGPWAVTPSEAAAAEAVAARVRRALRRAAVRSAAAHLAVGATRDGRPAVGDRIPVK